MQGWTAAGLDPALFWDITPREAGAILRGAEDLQWREMQAQQALAYSLAQLVKIGFHDPKRMPDFKKAFPGRNPVKPQSEDDIMASLKMWFPQSSREGGK